MPGFPDGSVVKNQPANGDDEDSIPKSRRSPGAADGDPLQYSCLGSHRQRSLVGYSPRGHKRVGHDLASEHTCMQQVHGQIFLPTLGWKLSESWFLALFVAISPMTIVMLSTHLLNKRIRQEVKRMTDKTYRKTSEKGVISLSKTSKWSVNASGMFDIGLKSMGGFS